MSFRSEDDWIACKPTQRTRGSRAIQQHIFTLLAQQHCNTSPKLKQIHTQLIHHGFTQKSFILAKLVSLYVAFNNTHYAQKVFERITNPNTNVTNQMIRGYVKAEKFEKSVELYTQMIHPDEYSYSFVLSGCAKLGLFRVGQQLHGRVLAKGYSSNVFVMTNLINLYGNGGDVRDARKVFDEMCDKSVVSWNSLLAGYVSCGDVDGAMRVFRDMPERSVVSWTTMVAGCARNGMCRQALFLFNEMRRKGCGGGLDQVALVAALSACAELGDFRLGRWIHSCVERKVCFDGQQVLVSLNNALIHMYACCGRIEEAYEVFKRMEERNTVSWTSVITAFAKQGCAEEALHLFQLMQSPAGKEVKPDEITLVGVLYACGHAGLINEGRKVFEKMEEIWGIEPTIEHYGCMIDLLSRAGYLDEACALIEKMPMKPNVAVWGALLGGCRIFKNSELASDVAQNLTMEVNPEQLPGYLVLLSNVYANAKKWQDVISIRQKLADLGVRKPAGRSWVQINGDVHDFVAGDMTHKHTSSVYEMLGKVTLQAKQEGYLADILLDVVEY